MALYGYEPANYVPDNSGYGRAAQQLGQAATQIGAIADTRIQAGQSMDLEYKKATDFKGHLKELLGIDVPEPPTPGPMDDPAKLKAGLDQWAANVVQVAIKQHPELAKDPNKLGLIAQSFDSSYQNPAVSKGIGKLQFQQQTMPGMQEAAVGRMPDSAFAPGVSPEQQASMFNQELAKDPKVLFVQDALANFGTPAGDKAMDRLHEFQIKEMEGQQKSMDLEKTRIANQEKVLVQSLASHIRAGGKVYDKATGKPVDADLVDITTPSNYLWKEGEFTPKVSISLTPPGQGSQLASQINSLNGEITTLQKELTTQTATQGIPANDPSMQRLLASIREKMAKVNELNKAAGQQPTYNMNAEPDGGAGSQGAGY